MRKFWGGVRRWSRYLNPLNPDLVTNGGFDTDTNWTKGTGWTISGGVATFNNSTGTTLSQAISSTAGITYRITFDLNVTAGSVSVSLFGGGSSSGGSFNTTGSHTVDITSAGHTGLGFTGVGGSDFTLDNITMRVL